MSDDPVYNRAYYRANKARIAARKAHRQKHDLDYRLKAVLRTIVQRCDDPRHVSYEWYGGKGIKNFLTLDDLKFLWKRDCAAAMKRPSIDRESDTDNYTREKCCFIPHADNVRKAVRLRQQRLRDPLYDPRVAIARRLHAKVAPFHPRYKLPEGAL